MNFKEGRGILPSSQTENLIEQIRLSKMDPSHNYTMAQVMKGMGDIKQIFASITNVLGESK